ncbi:hypothetical protein NC651_017452 [Populus alba x Populus x berolinensis]|nr:hypothetical protein NC651_017452 [Populus alba x Populus x berolinensis]
MRAAAVVMEKELRSKRPHNHVLLKSPCSLVAFHSRDGGLLELTSDLEEGWTTLPRSGLSFRLNSAHLSASLANNVASSSGQSGTAGSSI